MKGRNSIVAFLDILGYKELIEIESAGKEVQFFNELRNAMGIALETVATFKTSTDFLENRNQSDYNLSSKFNVRQFSDNIFLSFDYEDENDNDFLFGLFIISHISAYYQLLMMIKGYFIRGGISSGLNMVDENFIFSTALIKAVDIEKVTNYPRIALDPRLYEYVYNSNNQYKDVQSFLFVSDWANNVFVNPFNVGLRTNHLFSRTPISERSELSEHIKIKHKNLTENLNSKDYKNVLDDTETSSVILKFINANIEKYQTSDQRIFEKYLWLENFLNWTINGKSDLSFKSI